METEVPGGHAPDPRPDPAPERDRVGDCVAALVLCVAALVPAVVRIGARDFVLRDDRPLAPRFVRLRLDPNVDPVGLMPVLPGVGPVLARRIDAERRRMPFADADDLLRVHGIGPATLEAVRPHLRFGPTR